MESKSPVPVRERSVDVARGIAIVAIVLGHVERGLAAASLLPYDTALTVDRLVYLFHLATFAYLSGLFVRRTVERDGPRRVVTRRLMLFTWLYLLWTLVQGSVRIAASSVVNTPVTVGDVARIWIPEGQLWFLPWLIAVTAVAAVTQPWRSGERGTLVLVLAGVLALAVWGLDPPYAFAGGWALLLPFLLGCVVTQSRHATAARRIGLVIAGAVLGTAAWLSSAWRPKPQPRPAGVTRVPSRRSRWVCWGAWPGRSQPWRSPPSSPGHLWEASSRWWDVDRSRSSWRTSSSRRELASPWCRRGSRTRGCTC